MEAQSIRSASPKARLSDWSDESATAVLTADETDGSYLWIAHSPFATSSKVAELNTYLREIAEPKRVLIDYRGADDKDLKAELTYPYGHKEGNRYPLVVEVYPGVMVSAIGSGTGSSLLGHGYAILKPSMPLRPGDRPSAPLSDMPRNVMPAIEKVVEMGIADPERLAVMGQSYGGYAVLSLITQTKRFKAAIAQSPVSNWISFYGTFVMPLRYSGFQNEIGSMFFDTEEGQVGMKAPPWIDPARYVDNSPLFHVERVETPLMIIQGDIDYNSIGQGEEFFTALHRLGKKARFVRYWGEGHGIDSPANVRDCSSRIQGWLDEFLKPRH
jgi:dipeptidyl aminopeptidase/acylaminoacyl peptidase